ALERSGGGSPAFRVQLRQQRIHPATLLRRRRTGDGLAQRRLDRLAQLFQFLRPFLPRREIVAVKIGDQAGAPLGIGRGDWLQPRPQESDRRFGRRRQGAHGLIRRLRVVRSEVVPASVPFRGGERSRPSRLAVVAAGQIPYQRRGVLGTRNQSLAV